MIYEYSLISPSPIQPALLPLDGEYPPATITTALLCTNHQTRTEALPIFYAKNTIILRNRLIYHPHSNTQIRLLTATLHGHIFPDLLARAHNLHIRLCWPRIDGRFLLGSDLEPGLRWRCADSVEALKDVIEGIYMMVKKSPADMKKMIVLELP